jgi:hypothetical protein
MKYVVDTSLINKLVSGSVHGDELPKDGTFVFSHIQFDELSRTKNEKRRSELLQKFAEIIKVELPTDTFLLDVSRFDKAMPGEAVSYNALKAELNGLNGGKKNNCEDALILEMAMRDEYVLLTADYHMKEVATVHRIAYMYWTTGRFQGPGV